MENLKEYDILVVDDQSDNLFIIKSLLDMSGFKVAIATSGSSALEKLEKICPKLILLDINMPEMDGFEVCRILKANPKHKNIPVLFVTAYSDSQNIEEGFKLGAVDYITKPVRRIELLSRVEAHMKIANMNIYLEKQVEERTQELFKAKKKAEESDRLKTEFLHNMSHEIRTPMNGILGFTSFLSSPNITDAKRNQYIKIIQNSGEQLLKIIDAILEISALETNQVVLSNQKICLNNLLYELFTTFDVRAKENRTPLYLNKGLNDQESFLFVDGNRLKHILENLLDNALKFTSTGFVEFGYRLNNDAENPSIELFVQDTGVGINPENIEIIFERFSQEEKELSRKAGGLGLGLSIAKENAKLMEGTITVESKKGEGATFTLVLPYNPVDQDSETIIAKQTLSNRKNNVVLIVEDEEINYLYLEAVIEEFDDITILHAKNGFEAVAYCQKNDDIDIVLMDLKMKEMNGFEATKLIKAFKPELPIIAQTAYSTTTDRERAFAAGCDDFISKPIEKQELIDKIAHYFKNI